MNRLRSEGNATVDGQRAELARIERRIYKLVDLITEDDAPVKALKDELRMLEARQVELDKAIATAAAPAPLIHPNLAEFYRQRVAVMHEALRDPGSRQSFGWARFFETPAAPSPGRSRLRSTTAHCPAHRH